MKKNYEKLLINVISLDNADVITASGSAYATQNNELLGGSFNLGSLNEQQF